MKEMSEQARVRCRHIDCSSQPDNEEEIGKAMEEIFSDWIVNRPDVFLTAKLQEEEPSKFQQAVDGILGRLKVKYVDLLLLPVDQLSSAEQLQVHLFCPPNSYTRGNVRTSKRQVRLKCSTSAEL